jgi:ribonucleoside-triphosphate reductase (thioredoxin)
MKIVKIEQKEPEFTVDVEVAGSHTYQLGNGMVSHNTSSLVLGTSSGVHAWHNDFFIRRMRIKKTDALYVFLKTFHPNLVVDDFLKPSTDAVIEIPIRAPENAITRQESAIDLLSRVSAVWNDWVKPGHRKGVNKNNVSTTVSIKPDEWETVGEWMWNNRDNFTALSVLPYDGGTYIQAPYEDITEEEYLRRVSTLDVPDLSHVIETEDLTDLQNEAACVAGGCEVT